MSGSGVNAVLAGNSIPEPLFIYYVQVQLGGRDFDSVFKLIRSSPLSPFETVNASSILKSPELFSPRGEK